MTVDHRAQNSSATTEILNSWNCDRQGSNPPKTQINKVVRQVNLNPLMLYWSLGPLLGLGCPLTILEGMRREARQI